MELSSLIEDDTNLLGTSSVHQQSLVAPPNASDELGAANSADSMKDQKSSLKFFRPEDKENYKEELKLIQGTKIICSVDRLLDLLTGQHCKCCSALVSVTKHVIQGCTLIAWFTCLNGHKSKWSSSYDYCGVWANNLQLAASIILSGNNFTKIELMAKFFNLQFISSSTYYRVQRLYAIPGIEEWWQWMSGILIKDLENTEVILSGDGQCDSPGHNAKYLCYFLMDSVKSYIIHVEVTDKRTVGGTSTNMEREALRKALQKLQHVLSIVEVVTDASSSLAKMISMYMYNVLGKIY